MTAAHTIQTLITVVIMRHSGIITQAWGVEAAVAQTGGGTCGSPPPC